MGPPDVAVRPRRSAFAAAFLSFIFPGLGHAYVGRWLRALLWAALPLLGIALGLGLVFSSPDRSALFSNLIDPAVLQLVLLFLAGNFIYRLFAALDAYRLARDPDVGSAAARMASAAGLLALIVAMLVAQVAIAQPVLVGTDLLNSLAAGADDNSEIADLDELAANNPDFALNLEELEQVATPDPGASPGSSLPPITPVQPPTVPDQPPPTAVEPGTLDEVADPEAFGKEWTGKERLNILLIGADGGRQGRNDSSYLTDTMIVVSIDPPTGRVAFVSLPRDTAGIPVPRNWPAYRALGGKYNNKINTLYTMARGRSDLFPCPKAGQRGYCALMGALGALYGIDIKYYIAVDLNSFRAVVNTLGGVVVDVQMPVQDVGYPTGDGRGKLKLYIPPGMTRMNGQQALAYARSRHGSSDFDRSARQQTVITSVKDQTDLDSLLQPGVISRLFKQLKKDIRTNIPPKIMPKLVSLARDIDLDRRENLVLSDARGFSSVCFPCGSSGLWMLKANPAKMKNAVQNVFSNTRKQARTIQRLQDEGGVIWVLNGEGGSNTKALNIAANLSGRRGFDAVVPPIAGGKAETNDYRNTVITVYNGAREVMPETVKLIKRTFSDKGAEFLEVDDPEQEADIVVIVGKKTKALKP
ncbi:MAG: LCP family protein [Chloroflexota bacterium]